MYMVGHNHVREDLHPVLLLPLPKLIQKQPSDLRLLEKFESLVTAQCHESRCAEIVEVFKLCRWKSSPDAWYLSIGPPQAVGYPFSEFVVFDVALPYYINRFPLGILFIKCIDDRTSLPEIMLVATVFLIGNHNRNAPPNTRIKAVCRDISVLFKMAK